MHPNALKSRLELRLMAENEKQQKNRIVKLVSPSGSLILLD